MKKTIFLSSILRAFRKFSLVISKGSGTDHLLWIPTALQDYLAGVKSLITGRPQSVDPAA
ncbi:MAG: hypothetical protein AB2L20_18630 [Mangrovibacterium sp.]